MANLRIKYLPYQVDIFFPEKKDYKYLIIPKGRRVGITKGAAHAFIEYMLESPIYILWVDTINGNIDRYYDRYFLPILKQLEGIVSVDFNKQKRELKIGPSTLDFRSAEHPENIEGFGYNYIFLNEAGIILKDSYLYTNSILPMMMDYPDSVLIAAGVPKGKITKSGEKHKFYELYENAIAGKKGYKILHYTSYDNPILEKEVIDDIAAVMSPKEVDQEIGGEFLDMTGTNPFAWAYDEKEHESLEAIFKPERPIKISVDFNRNPFGVSFGHSWYDAKGYHSHTFDEATIQNGSIPAMADLIRQRYEPYLRTIELSGDAMGKRGDLSQRDNASYYMQLKDLLGLRDSQLKLVNNPTHDNSRADFNYVLKYMDYKLNPKSCPNACLDMKIVQCDAFGEIIKKNRNDISQRADLLDCERYRINTWMKEWIAQDMKRRKKVA